ncbi:MAG: phenylacetic acid degradation operon negative regulatory protein [Candidatus Berkelbacteria bacterium Licking1014_2]|uniref:Phenylacetic acid degradation operon negative regulatory protein n=1 Tax=Candidatus Berkelbacteria bacterium Licking1014_2 TaxID=2017146 RepID=A0A554LVJ7_9BACT|nr:MAG: phenylacetic acid degradation operon negative regulatory protein [Candidatus Berkelbacteria bacterium Licking1014_2]
MGYIDKNLKICPRGIEKINLIVPKINQSEKWDGRWCLVTFDIPEKMKSDREKLRRILKKLHFGRLQDSVWISPYDYFDNLQGIVEENNLQDWIIVSITKKLGREKSKDLAAKVWPLQKINERYADFIKNYQRFTWRIDRCGLIFRYLNTLQDDPQLPHDLLPNNWFGQRAKSIYEKIISSRNIDITKQDK